MYKVIESIKNKSWIRIQVVSFLRNQIKPSIYFVDPCLENPMDIMLAKCGPHQSTQQIRNAKQHLKLHNDRVL